MASEDETTNNAEAPKVAQAPRMQVLGQFIRDLSFENIAAQKGVSGEVQPDIQVEVNLDARKRSQDNQFDVPITLKITSTNTATKETIFLLEIEYSGIFLVENVPDEQLHPFLLIECPRMLFPFLRRIVSDITRDGGFPPLNLDNIDFLGLYQQELARRTAQEAPARPN